MIGMTVCSGIGAPELAAPWIDWKYQSEIDPFACAVLRERFPDAENLGDMTKFKEWPDAEIDVLCGGTPCQGFSIAGLRKGLADPRGNLTLTYLAVAERYCPQWMVWENVSGVLSALSHEAPDQSPPEIDLDSDDGPRDGEEVVVVDQYRSIESHALWCFMAGASQLGYSGGFISLDAQYIQAPGFPFAVPQRRDRVFFVGYLGNWTRAGAVLLDAESLRGNPPPRREAGKAASALTARGVGTCGADDNQAQAGHLITSHEVAPCLTAREHKGALPEADLSAVVAYTPAVALPWAVRRLTPTECERLMGFPDNFTCIPWRGKPADQCPDGHRYRVLGNSWATNCGEYIFDRIKAVEEFFE